jgi:hypothetical protein
MPLKPYQSETPMLDFLVTVKTQTARICFIEIAFSAVDAIAAVNDRFGGLCAVTVTPA